MMSKKHINFVRSSTMAILSTALLSSFAGAIGQYSRDQLAVSPQMVNLMTAKGNLILMNHLKYNTTKLGSAEQPTIEGGIINRTNSVSASFEMKSFRIHLKKANPENHDRYNDPWVNNGQVKKLLIAASKNGKLKLILKKANEMGIPASVALLPMVESQYQSHAISNKGAIGAWQILPSTASEYHLPNIQHSSFSAQTDVALKFISNLYREFHSWELAFAAYNAGPARVKRILKGAPYARNLDELPLPNETKQYINRLRQVNHELEKLVQYV